GPGARGGGRGGGSAWGRGWGSGGAGGGGGRGRPPTTSSDAPKYRTSRWLRDRPHDIARSSGRRILRRVREGDRVTAAGGSTPRASARRASDAPSGRRRCRSGARSRAAAPK